MRRRPPRATRTDTLLPDTTHFRSGRQIERRHNQHAQAQRQDDAQEGDQVPAGEPRVRDLPVPSPPNALAIYLSTDALPHLNHDHLLFVIYVHVSLFLPLPLLYVHPSSFLLVSVLLSSLFLSFSL